MKSLETFRSSMFCLLLALPISAETWSSYRGPTGMGVSAQSDLPLKWDANSVAWRIELEGEGQSSVVNWGNKLFVTSAKDHGRARLIHCLDATSGKSIWKQSVDCSQPESTHKMNSWATPTCATDGESVVAFFGPGGLHSFDMDGKPKWSRTDLGNFPGQWGTAASPIMVGDMVVQNCDAQGKSYLLAVDKKTGKNIWSTPRKDTPRGGWSTPILIDTGKRKELVLNGEFGAQAYDPVTGKDLWFCKAFNGRGAPVPFFAHNMVYVVNGKPGDLYVVKPGGEGDVTNTHMAFHEKRVGGRDIPSPVVVGDYLFVTSVSGVGTTYNAHTGDIFYSERINGKFSASPTVANGLAYLMSENGDVVIVRPGKKLDLVAHNKIGAPEDEIFRATVSPINGRLYLRSNKAVYCVK